MGANLYVISDAVMLKNENIKQITPILGNDLTARQYFEYALPWYNKSGKLMTPGEVGCALSHIEAYKRILEDSIPGVIFEADILLSGVTLDKVLEFTENRAEDFIHLGWHPLVNEKIYFKGSFDEEKKLFLVNPNVNFYGGFAYYISPMMAKILLNIHMKHLIPADSWAIIFNMIDINPYFYPLLSHPEERGSLHKQRLSVKGDGFQLNKESIKFYLSKKLKRSLSYLKYSGDIRPEDERIK